MDIATLIGLLGSMAVVFVAMVLGGSLLLFINTPAMLIVFGGSFMVVMMKFSLGQFLGAIKIAFKAFTGRSEDASVLIEKAVELANAARKGGLLSLENMPIENPFLQKGVQLLVDGHEPDVVRNVMFKDMNLTVERHDIGLKIFKSIGDVGPAMGMIGTLIGLVAMLAHMDDPKSIGPAMAVALLTTLYGAVLANMLAFPIADKLQLRSNEERLTKSLIIDALIGIQAGQNPRVIQEMLKNYLPVSKRQIVEQD